MEDKKRTTIIPPLVGTVIWCSRCFEDICKGGESAKTAVAVSGDCHSLFYVFTHPITIYRKMPEKISIELCKCKARNNSTLYSHIMLLQNYEWLWEQNLMKKRHRKWKNCGKNMKKQLTDGFPYNIITQCDEVRKLPSQSPGEGVFISGFGHFRDYFLHRVPGIIYFRGSPAVIQTIVDK